MVRTPKVLISGLVLSLTATAGVAVVEASNDDPVLVQAIQAQAAHKTPQTTKVGK